MSAREPGEATVRGRPFPVSATREHGHGDGPQIAIVGAGASGTLAAVHLLRAGGARVTLIDPAGHGLGLAYSTREAHHLLNVPACSMSGLDGEGDDLLEWCRGRGLPAAPEDYLPRQLYGVYLQQLLMRFADRGRLRLLRARVEDLHEEPRTDNVRLTLSGGRSLSADAAILALGNPSPAPLGWVPAECAPMLVSDPWAPAAMRRIAAAGQVAILGSGLTAVDVALSVTAANPQARVTAVSRNGWLPRTQLPGPPPSPRALYLRPGHSLDYILSVLAGEIAARPAAWREVVDGLRPHTAELWQGLGDAERARFERELRTWWEVHRHRIAPPVADRIDGLLADGRLEVRSRGVRALRRGPGGGVRVELGDGGQLDADVLVNATGPSRDLGASSNSLIRRMLAGGRIRPDELGIGFATSPEGALVDRRGGVSRRCFTLGPPRRGELLESTAIPEIRAQAARLAGLLSDMAAEPEQREEVAIERLAG
jgi:uncharacterized NAD(P)/FAD-binding protein YdhS